MGILPTSSSAIKNNYAMQIMRWILKMLLMSGFLLAANGTMAQHATHYDLVQLLRQNKLISSSLQQTHVSTNTTKKAISSKGLVWLKGVSFGQGSIDIDLRGKNVFLQSFLGLAFHGVDSLNYDVLYFRPFNFKHADTARRKWSVQYMSLPDYDYARLRKEHPLVYENAVNPVPDPDDWFHARIVIKKGWLSVYVNHSPIASLEVKLLNDREGGNFGLWDDGDMSGDFADLTLVQ
jgi:hypothetical protein